MPLTQFLAMLLFVLAASALTVFGALSLGVPMGWFGLLALAAGLSLRAYVWR